MRLFVSPIIGASLSEPHSSRLTGEFSLGIYVRPPLNSERLSIFHFTPTLVEKEQGTCCASEKECALRASLPGAPLLSSFLRNVPLSEHRLCLPLLCIFISSYTAVRLAPQCLHFNWLHLLYMVYCDMFTAVYYNPKTFTATIMSVSYSVSYQYLPPAILVVTSVPTKIHTQPDVSAA